MSNYFVLAATGGLIILHAAQIQPKNTSSVLIANLLSIAVATIAYWACGFAFAIGNPSNSDASNIFLSHTRFFLIDATDADYATFVTQALILGLVIVIANTGFIARMRCWIYPIIITIVGGFLYPCAHHWVYTINGWLGQGITDNDDGKAVVFKFVDVYGAATIHVFGGSCALIGTIVIGSRRDRKDKRFTPLGGNVNPLIVIGGLLTIVGLVAKNNAGNLGIINNILGAYGSAIVSFLFKRIKNCGDTAGTKSLINGAIAGVVGVSCAPDHYHPYAGFVIGVVAGLAYVAWSALFRCCHIDDPTDSAAVHLGAGFWAAIAGPIFRKDTGIIYVSGTRESFSTFGWQLLGALAIFVWAGLTLFIIMLPFLCARCATYKDAALEGLDAYEHDDAAFPDRSQYSQDYDPGSSFDDIIPIKASFKIGSYDNEAIHAQVENGKPGFYGNVEA